MSRVWWLGQTYMAQVRRVNECFQAAPRFGPQDPHPALLIAWCGVETAVFFWTVHYRIAPDFPTGFDQMSYYAYAYDLVARTWSEGRKVLT